MLAFTLISFTLAATWTVDPAGGGDATTVAEGVALMAEGDTLRIAAGNYAVWDVMLWPGSVVIEGAGRGETVFDGSMTGGTSKWYGLYAVGADVEIRGITFKNYTKDYGDYGRALVLEGNVAVRSCSFENNLVGVLVDPHAADETSLTDTVFSGNEWGIYIYESFDALRVEGSTFIQNSVSLEYSTDTYNMLTFNQLSLVNNTFVGTDGESINIGGGFSSYTGSGAFKVELVNNIFSGTDRRWRFPVGTWYGEDITIRNNLYASTTTASIQDDIEVTYADNQEADAVFVSYSDDGDWTNDDLRLAEGSPGLDDGVSGYNASEVDAYGTPRSEDGDGDGIGAPDIGAFERCPTDDCARADTGGETGGDTGGSSTSEASSESGSGGDSSPRPADRSLFSCASGGAAPASGLLLSGVLVLSLARRRRTRP